ncbi:MAG: hypothetical protein ACR2PR_02515, partial [Pseudohongiellaceae bacterium]
MSGRGAELLQNLQQFILTRKHCPPACKGRLPSGRLVRPMVRVHLVGAIVPALLRLPRAATFAT